ncbi:hypothetical protein ACO2Q8_26655 [Larkinella sp. VNQ87]|uniref:hypothetical protein n=1 Tax=Larkinella sp. VNQ87 TaxID=3400921 RepID=UPI003C0C3AB8
MSTEKYFAILSTIALVLLLLLILISPDSFVYDEIFFYQNILLLEKYGLSAKFLQEMESQAPGPLYQILHFLTSRYDEYSPLTMRIINLSFSLFIIASTAKIINILTFEISSRNYYFYFLITFCLFFSIPNFWTISVLALTEAPSLMMALVGAVLFTYLCVIKSKCSINYLYFSLSVLFFAFSLYGRITLITIPVGLVTGNIILETYKQKRLTLNRSHIALVLALALSLAPLVYVWKGVVPPKNIKIKADTLDIELISHGFSYFMAYYIILKFISSKTQIYRISRNTILLYILIYISVLSFNYFFLKLKVKFSLSLIVSLLGKGYSYTVLLFIGGNCLFISIIFIRHILQQLYSSLKNNAQQFLWLWTACLSITPIIAISQVSSRYIVLSIPSLVIYFFIKNHDYITSNKLKYYKYLSFSFYLYLVSLQQNHIY